MVDDSTHDVVVCWVVVTKAFFQEGMPAGFPNPAYVEICERISAIGTKLAQAMMTVADHAMLWTQLHASPKNAIRLSYAVVSTSFM